MAAYIVQDSFLFLLIINLLTNFGIKVFQIAFSKSIVGKKSLNLIIDILGNVWLVAILKFEFIDKHAFKLFSFLDFH